MPDGGRNAASQTGDEAGQRSLGCRQAVQSRERVAPSISVRGGGLADKGVHVLEDLVEGLVLIVLCEGGDDGLCLLGVLGDEAGEFAPRRGGGWGADGLELGADLDGLLGALDGVEALGVLEAFLRRGSCPAGRRRRPADSAV